MVIHQGQQGVKLQAGALETELGLSCARLACLLDNEVVHNKAMVIAQLH